MENLSLPGYAVKPTNINHAKNVLLLDSHKWRIAYCKELGPPSYVIGWQIFIISMTFSLCFSIESVILFETYLLFLSPNVVLLNLVINLEIIAEFKSGTLRIIWLATTS